MSGKFRLKLNLFDGIVLTLAFCAAVVLGYLMFKPAPVQQAEVPVANTVEYTIRFNRMLKGAGALIQPGDELIDTVKNYKLGKVVSVDVIPSQVQVVDQNEKKVVSVEVEEYEDAFVTVQGTGTMGDSCILLDGGYSLRVNAPVYVKGNGYMGSGPVVSIEREVK